MSSDDAEPSAAGDSQPEPTPSEAAERSLRYLVAKHQEVSARLTELSDLRSSLSERRRSAASRRHRYFKIMRELQAKKDSLLSDERQLHGEFNVEGSEPTRPTDKQLELFSSASTLISQIKEVDKDLVVVQERMRELRTHEFMARDRERRLEQELAECREAEVQVRAQAIDLAVSLGYSIPKRKSLFDRLRKSSAHDALSSLVETYHKSVEAAERTATANDYASRHIRNTIAHGNRDMFLNLARPGPDRDLAALRSDQRELSDDSVIGLVRAMAEERPDLLAGFAFAALRGPDAGEFSPRVKAALADVLRTLTKELEQQDGDSR